MKAVNLLLLAIVALSQLAEFAESNEASRYYNQVIYIETLRYRGHWLDAHHSRQARFTPAPERDLIGKIWAKWIVRRGPGGAIALESVRYRHHYLDAHHSRICRVTYSVYPSGSDWALWYMERRGDGAMELRSKRYSNSRLDAYHAHRYAKVTSGSGYWSRLRIYQPHISERKALISVFNNRWGNTPVTHTFKETIGISKSTSTSISITSEVGAEIKGMFTAKLSTTWSHTSSQTWSTQVEKSIQVQVLPGYVKRIYQLQGNYGPFQISSSRLYFEDSRQ